MAGERGGAVDTAGGMGGIAAAVPPAANRAASRWRHVVPSPGLMVVPLPLPLLPLPPPPPEREAACPCPCPWLWPASVLLPRRPLVSTPPSSVPEPPPSPSNPGITPVAAAAAAALPPCTSNEVRERVRSLPPCVAVAPPVAAGDAVAVAPAAALAAPRRRASPKSASRSPVPLRPRTNPNGLCAEDGA